MLHEDITARLPGVAIDRPLVPGRTNSREEAGGCWPEGRTSSQLEYYTHA